MDVKKIMELLDIIQNEFSGLYEELKEFPETVYSEHDFNEKAKFTLLIMLGKLLE